MHYCNRYTAFHRTSKISLFCAQFKDDIGKIVFPLSHHSNSIVLAFLHCLYPFGQSAKQNKHELLQNSSVNQTELGVSKEWNFCIEWKVINIEYQALFHLAVPKRFSHFPFLAILSMRIDHTQKKKHNTRGKSIPKASC